MRGSNTQDMRDLPDEYIEAADLDYAGQMLASSEALRNAIWEQQGKLFNCGHMKTASNVQLFRGEPRCKRCRRLRWTRGFTKVCERILQQKAADRRRRMEAEMRSRQSEDNPAFKRNMPAFDYYNPELSFNVKRLVVETCAAMGVDVKDFYGPNRKRHPTDARRVVANILHDRGWSYNQIKEKINRRDHSTVINLVRNFEAVARTRPSVGVVYAKLSEKYARGRA